MTVNELREALKDIPGDRKITIIPPTNNDEWDATVVTASKYGSFVALCANNKEVGVNERVLHDDNAPEGE